MQEILQISNATPEQDSLNFSLLREVGIEHIQKLASKIWTDYNTHDPGITILEQLIYAITELGYRSNFDIKDILAQNPEVQKKIKTGLFTAPEIMSNAPANIDDYRKLLIDLDGVRNAFLKIADKPEIPVFVDNTTDSASFTQDELVNIRGLYSVILELDKDEEFGDLNSTLLDWEFTYNPGPNAKILDVEVSFPDWLSIAQIFRNTIYPNASSSDPRISSISLVSNSLVLADRRTYAAVLNVVFFGPTIPQNVEIPITLVILDDVSKLDPLVLYNSLSSALNTTTNPALEDFILLYNTKMIKTWEIVNTVQDTLNKYRNLCEDFVELKNLLVEEVGMCLQIEVGPGADIEQIEAEIYFRVGNFLSPRMKFRSATELLNKGLTVDQIFDGPVLQHGFLDLKEFLTIDERKVLYVSDLIQIIMDIPGVISVADIHLNSYIDNLKMSENVMDCLAPVFEESHRLRLSLTKSSTVFFRDDDPTDPNKVFMVASRRKVKERIRELEILDNSLVVDVTLDEFDVPLGEYKNLEEYHSVQHTFPLNYGIGSAGLNANATPMRNAQAKQLKSYLLLSEQLLANLLSQLSHIKELFAIDKSLKRTYFTQLVNYPDAFPVNAYEPYVDEPNIAFIVADILEGKTVFLDRRNRVLDHLLARFSESFNTYSLKMFEVFGLGIDERILADKLNFLDRLPVVSADRLRSYNYKATNNVWNTDNVPGYQKRVSLKLGIENTKRKSLYFNFDERPLDIERVFRLYEKMDGNDPSNASKAQSIISPGNISWTANGMDADGLDAEGETPTILESVTGLMQDEQESEYLYVTDFDFSYIPSGAVIEGIKVEVVKRVNPAEVGVNIAGNIQDLEIKLLKDNAGNPVITGNNRARLDESWPEERRFFAYGGATDLWNTTWALTDIQNANFGVAIKVKKTGERFRRASIDNVKITVFYDLAGVTYHFDTQPESRAFGVSSPSAGYPNEQDRKNALIDVVNYGYNFCNYCKDLGSYRIKKANTVEDRDGMCEPAELPIVAFNVGAQKVEVAVNLSGKLFPGESIAIIDSMNQSFTHTVVSVTFVGPNTEVIVLEPITSPDPLVTLEYDKIKNVNVVYSGLGINSEQDAADFADKLFDVFWDFEGMHVIEHILLRPKVNQFLFEALPANTIVSPDQGKIRYELRKAVTAVNYITNELTIGNVNLTAQLPAGSVFKLIDIYGNEQSFTVNTIQFNSPDTIIKTVESLDEDQDLAFISFERNFIITNFSTVNNAILIGGQDLVAEIEDMIAPNQPFVFEIYNSPYNNGTYSIDNNLQVTLLGADTEIKIQHRKKLYADTLLPIHLSEDECVCPELKDNYSFRMTVVMPEWPVRNTRGNFRKFAERVLRYEAPAHVYVRLVWINREQMKNFEATYKTWLEQYTEEVPDPLNEMATTTYRTEHNAAHNAFVKQLFALRSRLAGTTISDVSDEEGSTGELSLLGQIYLG